jgi:hypothetical protein
MVSSRYVHYDPAIGGVEKDRQRAHVTAEAARYSNAQRQRRLNRAQRNTNSQSFDDERICDNVRSAAEPRGRSGEKRIDTWRGRGDIMIRHLSGNSDPFDAFDIAITPKITRLMDFIRNVSIPSTYGEFWRTCNGLLPICANNFTVGFLLFLRRINPLSLGRKQSVIWMGNVILNCC